jgi:hypothetical protein
MPPSIGLKTPVSSHVLGQPRVLSTAEGGGTQKLAFSQTILVKVSYI